LKGSGVFKIALHVIDAVKKPLPEIWIDRMVLEFCDFFAQHRPERIRVHLIESEADDGELF
jgi:hypothetical protein